MTGASRRAVGTGTAAAAPTRDTHTILSGHGERRSTHEGGEASLREVAPPCHRCLSGFQFLGVTPNKYSGGPGVGSG